MEFQYMSKHKPIEYLMQLQQSNSQIQTVTKYK
jgi:hypothetical protein